MRCLNKFKQRLSNILYLHRCLALQEFYFYIEDSGFCANFWTKCLLSIWNLEFEMFKYLVFEFLKFWENNEVTRLEKKSILWYYKTTFLASFWNEISSIFRKMKTNEKSYNTHSTKSANVRIFLLLAYHFCNVTVAQITVVQSNKTSEFYVHIHFRF